MKRRKGIALTEVAKIIGAVLDAANPELKVFGINTMKDASVEELSFLSNPQFAKYLSSSQAGAIILKPEQAEQYSGNKLVMDDPYLGYARASQLFTRDIHLETGLHPTAVVSDKATVHPTARIGPRVVVESDVVIESEVVVESGSVIGCGAVIGRGSHISKNVTICHGVNIGKRVIIHCNAVIGCDGFGNAFDTGKWCKIASLGSVMIGDDVEIGASTCIDRGALGNTIIGCGVRLDNLVHIAHNVTIGDHTAIAAMVGIAGSTDIGKYCLIGGQAGINGHLTITDKVTIGGKAMITGSITDPGSYSSGTGFMNTKLWRKNTVRYRHLDEIARRLNKLEEYVLEKKDNMKSL